MHPAWIEVPGGDRVPVVGNLALGRTPANQVVLADDRVSRRHAVIHAQGADEFWLVDHGSRNGTYVNERRVLQPARLRDGDQIRIGPFGLTFHQLHDTPDIETTDGPASRTLVDLRSAPCWLLVADVVGSTALAQSLPPDQFAVLMGGWFKRCQALVESHGGTLNKYLGDGFLAFWKADPNSATAVAPAVSDLRQLQSNARPPFRFVLHHGEVLLGGGGTLGEESLSGPALNFVFRMEKLAGGLREGCLLSETASRSLGQALPLRPVGKHPLPSFAGQYSFFGL